MISEEKQRLRAAMRAKLRLPEAAGRGVRTTLSDWAAWSAAGAVCAFFPLPGEVDVLRDWPPTKRLALPRIAGDTLVFHWMDSVEDLVDGPFGTKEPDPGCPVAGGTFDLLLVPGLAFDPGGGRLGRGRGFYDRFLRTATGLRVGVCHSWQIVDAVPREDHDLRMDFLLTPDALYDCANRRITP